MIIVVMGVSGSGKSTIGTMLAAKLDWPFYDGDSFHPQQNIEKMAAGFPLMDEDRWPWLDALAAQMPEWEAQGGAVTACSALRQVYRDRLRSTGAEVRFVYLRCSKLVLLQRLEKRRGHFMKARMLESQLETLEEPAGAIVVNGDAAAEVIVAEALRGLGRGGQ